jgi:NAD(P)H dehydrogenase (quinone)
MNVLIIFAHPRPKGSFNHAVLDQFTRGLADAGHSFEVVDLYRIGFDPVFREQDYLFLADETIPEDVLEAMEWHDAWLEGSRRGPFGFIKSRLAERWLRGKTTKEVVREMAKYRPKDVLEQQEKVRWAEALVFISPILWMHYPAIMKGWVERVFTYGFAYELSPEGWKGDSDGRLPLLELKKALSINTTFFTAEDYESKGFYAALDKIIDEWGLRFPGIPDVQHEYLHSVLAVDDRTRGEYLGRVLELGRRF